jgi:NitT/TauT family transport system permease protein
MHAAVVPFAGRRLGRAHTIAFAVFWAAIAVAAWAAAPVRTLPGPGEVLSALGTLWWEGGLGRELGQTLGLIAEALFVSVALSLAVAWSVTVPALRPIARGLSKLRFLGLTGLVFPFTLAFGGGHALKVALLTFGMSTFLVTQVARIVDEIPRAELDLMRVLGAGRARTMWEVVVRGTLDKTTDAVRQNVAMGWSMITMVEGISRAEGGVGAMLLNQNKHFRLAEVYAILLVVLVVGLLIDAGMGALEAALCPHTRFVRRES